jgi:hypothetical protein
VKNKLFLPVLVLAAIAGGTDFVGHVDTVGSTTYDWQVFGPSDVYIYADSGYGVHVVWMCSAESSGHADRGMRYAYYDFATAHWDSSESSVFPERSGFGNLDVNPITHCAYVGCHEGGIYPVVARDEAPGAGIFEPCVGTPNADQYLWPSISLTHSEKVHVAVADNASRLGLYYSRVFPWCDWSIPVSIPNSEVPDPQFPTYIAKASKTSQKVVVSWVYLNTNGTLPNEGYYRQSVDDGATWAHPVQIPCPPAYTPGSETTASFYIAGIYPYLDYGDNLHVVAIVMPMIGGTGYVLPTEVWHWYQPTGLWSRIARHQCDGTHLRGSVGYNALFANRPTLAEGADDEFVCVWDAFDSMNVEPQTGILRADVYAARSADNGATWGPYLRLTDPDSTTRIFPSLSPRMVFDTCWVRYEQDLCAGFGIAPYGQGPITNNPIIVQRFGKDELPLPPVSVAEDRTQIPERLRLSAAPDPCQGRTVVSYELPTAGRVRLCICDALGRTVQALTDGVVNAGAHEVNWDARGAPAGAYFLIFTARGDCTTAKLTVTRMEKR